MLNQFSHPAREVINKSSGAPVKLLTEEQEVRDGKMSEADPDRVLQLKNSRENPYNFPDFINNENSSK